MQQGLFHSLGESITGATLVRARYDRSASKTAIFGIQSSVGGQTRGHAIA
jgi:hypothetical protein